MSKIDDIKNKKRSQKQVSPSHSLTEPVQQEQEAETEEEEKAPTKRKGAEPKIERKRVSFDLRTDLHKRMKMQSLMEERNIYLIIEDALEEYLDRNEE
ncbi:hypothetical protein [Salsuginibacillus kocurii]|uniref:hypothetical protein n=1 Tax=Salsuginibacillus kocurii TaxID=427078 RepID=UPI00036CE7B2|nr:hypothetical protein [Salsuginibacillus kocurii]